MMVSCGKGRIKGTVKGKGRAQQAAPLQNAMQPLASKTHLRAGSLRTWSPSKRKTKISSHTCKKLKLPSPDVGRRVGDEGRRQLLLFVSGKANAIKSICVTLCTLARDSASPYSDDGLNSSLRLLVSGVQELSRTGIVSTYQGGSHDTSLE